MNTASVPRMTLALALLLSGGPALADPHKDESGKGKGRWSHADKGQEKHGRKSDAEDWWRNIRAKTSHGRFEVPPGHRPPPGMCRRWYPGLPPGQQPPPEECSRLRRDRDTFIIYGDQGYDPRYPWSVSDDEAALRAIPHAVLDILLDRVK